MIDDQMMFFLFIDDHIIFLCYFHFYNFFQFNITSVLILIFLNIIHYLMFISRYILNTNVKCISLTFHHYSIGFHRQVRQSSVSILEPFKVHFKESKKIQTNSTTVFIHFLMQWYNCFRYNSQIITYHSH